jgi:hypothetical protein
VLGLVGLARLIGRHCHRANRHCHSAYTNRHRQPESDEEGDQYAGDPPHHGKQLLPACSPFKPDKLAEKIMIVRLRRHAGASSISTGQANGGGSICSRSAPGQRSYKSDWT